MREIITDEEKLSFRCDEAMLPKEGAEVRGIVVELKSVTREQNLSSLAANQLGFEKRIFVINFNGDLRSYVNPIITRAEGLTLSTETCPSLPNKKYIRPRNTTVYVTYQTPLGKIVSEKLMGLAAIVFQHELDHLDGLLLSDVGLEVTEEFERGTEEEKDKILAEYLDSLDIKQKEVEKEIAEDKGLSMIYEAIDFESKLAKGEIKLEKLKETKDESNEV